MKATKIFIILMIILAFSTLACSFLSRGLQPATVEPQINPPISITTPSGEIQPTQPQIAQPTDKPATEAQPTLSTPEQPLNPGGSDAPTRDIGSVASGLESLDSYRLVTVTNYSGTDSNNQSQTMSINSLQEYIRSSGDNHLKLDTTSSTTPAQNSTFESFTIDGVSYMLSTVDGQQQCISFSGSDPLLQDPLSNSDLFGDLTNLKLVQKNEMVNGIMTDHYTLDETSFPPGDFQTAKGNIWIAQDGGYIVKSNGSGEGTIEYPWSGTSTTTWDYELQAVNDISNLAVPEDCTSSGVSSDIPIPANATNKSTIDKITSFESPDSPGDLAKYYQDELTAAGWTKSSNMDLGGMYVLVYTKDGQELTVTITPGAGNGSAVLLVLGP